MVDQISCFLCNFVPSSYLHQYNCVTFILSQIHTDELLNSISDAPVIICDIILCVAFVVNDTNTHNKTPPV